MSVGSLNIGFGYFSRVFSFRKVCFFLILSNLFLFSCKAEKYPDGVPESATYDKRQNIYTHYKEGVMYQYFKDGNLYQKCEVDSAKVLDGYCEFFLRSTGQKISWGHFKKGQRHGEWVWAFEDGSVYIRQNFEYGKKKDFWLPLEIWGNDHGPYFRYYPDGSLDEKGSFDTGLKSGDWKKYYPDGSLEYSGSYKKGKRTGSWILFYPNGVKEAEEKYSSEGSLVLRKTYYPNGNLWCVVDSQGRADCREP